MRWTAIALWTVFALLIVVGGGEFLFACGFSLGLHLWNYCPAPIDRSASLEEATRMERLERLVHQAELRLAEKPVCAPPHPLPQPQPVFRPDQHPSIERGAKQGRVEVFLKWWTYDDLDLIIACPNGGQIGGWNGRSGSCGEGEVDIDANRNLTQHVSATPEEHAVWAHAAPDGQLRVFAAIFKAKNPFIQQDIPFEMTFKLGDQVKVCPGEVKWFPRSSGLKTDGGKLLAGVTLYLDWIPRQGLPTSCEWQEDRGHYCDPGECEKN